MTGLRHRWAGVAYFYSLLIVAVSLPFAKNLNSMTIGLVVFSWLAEGNFSGKWQRLKQNQWVWLFITYYLLHLVGLLYSENTKAASFILEKKSGMWVIPVLLATGIQLEKKQYDRLLIAFAVACTAGALICTSNALYQWAVGRHEAFLYYHALSSAIRIHAVYFSAYLVFSIFILIRLTQLNRKTTTRMYNTMMLAWIAFLTTFLFLLASKMIILAFIGISNLALIVHFSLRNSRWKGIGIATLSSVILCSLIFTMPQTRERFGKIIADERSIVKAATYAYDTPFTGLSLRLVLWKFTVEILNENDAWLTGVGTGDGQDKLDEKYKQHGLYTGNKETGDHGYLGYNTHNQYMQALLESGIIGLLLLLGLFLLPLRYAIKNRSSLHILLLLLLISFCLTESVLETHHGSVFFVLFCSLFLSEKQLPAARKEN